jgi:phenylacetate-CoA ligase
MMNEWAKTIRGSKIKFLYGYPSSVSEFAKHVLEHDYDLPMRAVFLTAEKYFSNERELIEKAFQCRSYNLYGSSEIQNIAFECTRGRLHIASDFVCVEQRPGSERDTPELITTSLLNKCMPFIRYALGDYGRVLPDDCGCGIHTPVMEVFGGSKYDFLDGPEGIVHGAVLERIFQKIENVQRYQIVQHSLGSYTIRVELAPGSDCDGVMATVRETASQVLSGLMRCEVRIQLENPARIAPGPNGKFRFIYRQPADVR